VDVLRQRIFEYEAVHEDPSLPRFDVLMSDHADVAPEDWPDRAYDELMARGHLDPHASGKAAGHKVFGRLSSDGRMWVLEEEEGLA
jgi:hypothetical protein